MFGTEDPLVIEEDLLESYLLGYKESSTNQTFLSYMNSYANEAQGPTSEFYAQLKAQFPQFVDSAILYAHKDNLFHISIWPVMRQPTHWGDVFAEVGS